MTITGCNELIKALESTSIQAESICESAVYEGAGIIADEAKARLEQNLNSPRSVSLTGGKFDRKQTEPTGDLLESFGISPINTDKNGIINAKVGFWGYDRKGVANVIKARVMESGSSKVKKRPFVRPALNKVRKRAQEAMRRVIETQLEKTMKG